MGGLRHKLLANELSSGRFALAAVSLVAVLGFGALAFLQENTALQHRPAVTVAPVILSVQVPLPVLGGVMGGL